MPKRATQKKTKTRYSHTRGKIAFMLLKSKNGALEKDVQNNKNMSQGMGVSGNAG